MKKTRQNLSEVVKVCINTKPQAFYFEWRNGIKLLGITFVESGWYVLGRLIDKLPDQYYVEEGIVYGPPTVKIYLRNGKEDEITCKSIEEANSIYDSIIDSNFYEYHENHFDIVKNKENQ